MYLVNKHNTFQLLIFFANGYAFIKRVFLFFLLLNLGTVFAENYIPYGYEFSPFTYEQKTQPRKGNKTFTKDPNVWVYTSAFAKRFGMPEKWIDDSLEGAQAVAYRMQESNIETCGYFGQQGTCRRGLNCVFDVYITDEDSAKLPWESHKSSDWQDRESSSNFLAVQKESDLWYWQDEVNNKRYIRTGPKGLRSVVYVEGPPSKKGKHSVFSGQGPMRVREYRRDFYQGLDLIELSSCSAVRADNPVRFYFLDPLPSMREPKYRLPDGSINRSKLDAAKKNLFAKFDSGNPPHKIKLPDDYMDKVKAHDQAVRGERSLAKEVLKRLKQGDIDTQTQIPNHNTPKKQ